MPVYAATTFSPVQGFIEKSRKLRDLYGASVIISHLSKRLIDAAKEQKMNVISPGMPDYARGMPNRILLKNNGFDSNNQEFAKWLEEWANKTIVLEWTKVLTECQKWIEDDAIPEDTYQLTYHWQREWELWRNHTWEIFWGAGKTIPEAMKDLENRKLARNWTATNWIGESSSITGTDAIAWPGLASEGRNPKDLKYEDEKSDIEYFYELLATKLETNFGYDLHFFVIAQLLNNEYSRLLNFYFDTLIQQRQIEGKFLDPSERLSIPELTKRLITQPDIRKNLGLRHLERFTDIVRKPEPEKNQPGQWTGWFMGDGDKVGNYLQELAKKPDGEEEINKFSEAMREWGRKFMNKFNGPRLPTVKKLGRVIYAGGDDFLGVIHRTPDDPVEPKEALEWLMTVPEQWEEVKEKTEGKITLSVGFVWAAPSVPQRDVLQHCRAAEKEAKNSGRNRVTIRVLFNSGRFVQWTCPWNYLCILDDYRDREGGKNWTHIYNDLAQLKARHAINPHPESGNTDYTLALALMDIYFPNKSKEIEQSKKWKYLVKDNSTKDNSNKNLLNWINDLILVGWQMCS
ncbi:MAG: CRISPR-associated protein Cmr2 [Okeania sp. SIO3I5]|uniref:Cas10/Cmr2 second palm domain-containing protein n=1 Tax=Okeania sp. SIO3I5 TaxID=2607805 RepID=UPI0013B73D90|nr:type III-B CRISPR-associated protein Cas10/Cmr2 [Okeania sp. SIO3I5]NEQ39947.1 CRISPR-associated protein Cmr2 [Okeania sp. SIO3I5]